MTSQERLSRLQSKQPRLPLVRRDRLDREACASRAANRTAARARGTGSPRESTSPRSGASASGTTLRSIEDRHVVHERSRSSSNSGAPGARPSASASSMVAGRTWTSRTRAAAERPLEAAISEKLMSAFGGSPIRAPTTVQPPGWRATIPDALELCERTAQVTRLTPKCSASARSGGRREPGDLRPRAISSASESWTR